MGEKIWQFENLTMSRIRYIFSVVAGKIYKMPVWLLLLGGLLFSCQKVTIVVKEIPGNTPKGSVLFVTGNFNVFDPGDQRYVLRRNADSTYSITLPRGSGKITYKFTRGDWTTVERDGCGNEQPYRLFNLGEADTIYTQILSWEDLGPVACDLVTFVVKPPQQTPENEPLYIAGNFNNWNPEDEKYQLTKNRNGTYSIQVPKQAGTIEYKFTRGGWWREEVDEIGEPIPNRQFTYGRLDTVNITIPGWKDIEKVNKPYVTFMVHTSDNTPPEAPVYIVGTFNNWYAGDRNYRLQKVKENLYTITLPTKTKEIEFKFTRGGWQTEEIDESGNKISNRHYRYGTADTVNIFIPGWIDLPDRGAGTE
jgi:hypothetical protein